MTDINLFLTQIVVAQNSVHRTVTMMYTGITALKTEREAGGSMVRALQLIQTAGLTYR